MTLTQDELLVACGALAWCFNLKHKQDPTTGHNIPVPLDKSNSLLIIKPDPFQMAFEPRSEARKQEAFRLWTESETENRRAKEELESRRINSAELEVTREGRVPEKSASMEELRDGKVIYTYLKTPGVRCDI
jgi:hypothetical protein